MVVTKRITKYILQACMVIGFAACNTPEKKDAGSSDHSSADTLQSVTVDSAIAASQADTTANDSILVYRSHIQTGSTNPLDLVNYAKTLMGVPYKYASTNPANGFDCSGFITYVFNHFKIAVPRSSVDFTNVGTEVPYTKAQPGDLILFTGTDSTIRKVGHMGIVVNNSNGQLEFIHSTSGKAYGVTITPFETYYKSRFVKTIRIFPVNNIVI